MQRLKTGQKSLNIIWINFLALFLIGCQMQPPLAQQQNLSPINQMVVQNFSVAVQNTTNATNITITVPEPTLVLVDSKLVAYAIDTEKKGSTLLMLNNKSFLINIPGGTDELRLLKILKNLGINQLDYLLLTNDEHDNIDGVAPLILRINPLHLIHSGIPSSKDEYKLYTSLFPNSTIVPSDTIFTFEDSTISLIVPYDDTLPLTDDNTVLLKVNYGDFSLLVATDCKVDCESRIGNVKSKVIISNGGCNSLTYGFLKQVSPELVVFSGKPCDETANRIKFIDIPTLSTLDGDISISTNGSGYNYKSFKSR